MAEIHFPDQLLSHLHPLIGLIIGGTPGKPTLLISLQHLISAVGMIFNDQNAVAGLARFETDHATCWREPETGTGSMHGGA